MTFRHLKKTERRQILEDYAKLLTGFKPLNIDHLARIALPILQGVYFQPAHGRMEYVPTSHIHNLLVPFACVALELSHRVRTRKTHADDWIEFCWHKKKYHDTFERLLEQTRPRLDQPIDLHEVLELLYNEAVHWENRPNEWISYGALTLYLGDLKKGRKALEKAANIAENWPEDLKKSRGGQIEYCMNTLEAIRAGNVKDYLDNIMRKEIKRHKLEALLK